MLTSLPGWEQLLLEVLRHSTHGGPSTRGVQGSGRGADQAYWLLVRLLCHSAQCVPGGAAHLGLLAGLLRAQPGASYDLPPEKFSLPSGSGWAGFDVEGGAGGSGGSAGTAQQRAEGAGAWAVLHAVVADVMGWLVEAQAGGCSLAGVWGSLRVPGLKRGGCSCPCQGQHAVHLRQRLHDVRAVHASSARTLACNG